ncbi:MULTISPECIES: SDR family oxidoreductase [Ferrimicrobium]|uniref:SDR family oxidoreductase n=1 Tax=Ferrimicrobium acidiphilum TaxID=121039 RepID=A0ABV3XZD1_9ACTN|nr:SDR family oxidoreductase [Ferrimicrobium sp.]MCL5974038.1 SDR family oxidoreductase [Actinomycetota bacterium]
MAVAIVTGGSRGIGLATATRLVRDGHQVMLVARKVDELEAAAQQIRVQVPDGVVGVCPANLRDIDAPAAIFDVTYEMLGAVSLLVNNAATNPWAGPLTEITSNVMDVIYQVNLRAPTMMIQEFAKRLQEHELHGAVVNVASIGGLHVEPMIGWYNVLKAALIHLTRQFAAELGPRIRVNTVAPGLVRTQFAAMLVDSLEDRLSERLPLGRIGEPDDVARAIAFLLSSDAAWMTGSTIVIDGGNEVMGMF